MTDSQPQTGPFLAFQNPVSTFNRPHTPKENLIGAQSTGLVFSVLSFLWGQVYVYTNCKLITVFTEETSSPVHTCTALYTAR